ncbi:unnamed protein product [Menidia menidia]|uniref:(Atlantic silverside) hypothetical protein n=1 Tax=Menidia menidia TaxID=238744 RepID=A0A8S4AYR2_9TELE|nr:unnamed protein product [Menidia menidia]
MSGKNTKSRNTIQTQLRPGLHTAAPPSGEPPGSTEAEASPDAAALKVELMTSLKEDIAEIIKKQLQETLGDSLSTIQLDLQTVKTQLANNKAATDATLAELKCTVGEVENAECSDDIAVMKATISSLTANVAKLENKCEDLESRSRRNNIRIVGVPEGPGTCDTAAVSALLKEAFALEKEPLLDRSHRTLQPKPQPNE